MKSMLRNRFIAGMLALAMMLTTWMPAVTVKADDSVLPAATNISFSTARDLSFNVSNAEEPSESDTKRYYKFTLNEASALNINVTKTGWPTRFTIEIYDALKTSVYSFTHMGSYQIYGVSTDNIYLTGGTYYLEITIFNSFAPYSFVATKDSLEESFTETQDVNNDMISSASPIQLRTTYKGVLAQNDEVDYYQLTVPSAGKINFNMTNSTNGELKYAIYDSSMNTSYVKTIAKSGKASDFVALAKGTYYLAITKVKSDKGVGSYNFSIEHIATKVTAPKIKSVKNTGKKKMTVKWSKVTGVDGYELQYSTSKNFKKSVVKKNLSASKTSVNYSKLKKGKTYYVRMRSYIKDGSTKNYSKWSTKKSVKIKK